MLAIVDEQGSTTSEDDERLTRPGRMRIGTETQPQVVPVNKDVIIGGHRKAGGSSLETEAPVRCAAVCCQHTAAELVVPTGIPRMHNVLPACDQYCERCLLAVA